MPFQNLSAINNKTTIQLFNFLNPYFLLKKKMTSTYKTSKKKQTKYITCRKMAPSQSAYAWILGKIF